MTEWRTASLSSKPVVRARKLHRRSARHEQGRFLVEGPQAVREALAAGVVDELFGTETGLDRFRELVAATSAAKRPVLQVEDRTLRHLADTENPQGLVATAFVPRHTLAEVLSGATLIAVLVEAQDPGNVGTVIRIADAVGADAALLTTGSADVFNSKCVRATAGSLFHLPVVGGLSWPEIAAGCERFGLATAATSGTATPSLFDHDVSAALREPTAWVFGNEARGLPHDVIDSTTRQVRIPILGKAESLNLATAAAVCLYESARCRAAS